MKTLKITIGPKGGLTVDAEGFAGPACQKATAELLEKLGGTVTSDEAKPELYQHDQSQEQKAGQ